MKPSLHLFCARAGKKKNHVPHALHSVFHHRLDGKGIALVLVLGMLTLVVVLMVAFISSVSTELKSAKSYASGQDVRSLADSTVNIVISQIQDATENPRLAWASQPGMIRTYDTTGHAVNSYKLYSSDVLRISGNFNPSANLSGEVPPDWHSLPEQFTDLNSPVSSAGKNRYPIVSPAAVAQNTSGGSALEGTKPIEGCYLDTLIPAAQMSATQTNPVPMPVRWMYVLKDGKITPIDRTTLKVTGATADNPVIGRIAFWTDDETSKVNINTASEGTFWDRPWTRTPFDTKLSTAQPVQNEFQRFPGHPAMTSLSTIFPDLGGSVANNEIIYGITPRVKEGGSKGGTVLNSVSVLNNAGITPDTDRLFASVDEFLFSPATSTPRTKNLSGSGSTSLLSEDIEKARFFITANSRAPEVNLFNKPRISLWPQQIDPDPVDGSKTRTAKDKLIAFCSTIGTGINAKLYYFQRYNTYNFESNKRPESTSNWANKQTVPPSSQSPTMDWTEIPRNRALFQYLQFLTSNNIPGLGGSFSAKYPSTRDQILVEMLDYIRSSVNPQRTLDNKATANPNDIEYFYAPGYKRSNPQFLNVIGQQQVAPLIAKDGSTILGHGYGRFPSIKQAVLVFQASDATEYKIKEQPVGSGTFIVDHTAMNQGPLKMRVVLLLDPFNVTPGHPTVCPNVRYKVRWVDAGNAPSPCKVNGVALDFPETAINLITARDTESNLTAMGAIEYSYKYYEKPNSSNPNTRSDLPKRLGLPVVGADDEEQFYPFFTSQISVPGSPTGQPTFQFEGGDLEIEIYPGYTRALDPNDRIQTIRMSFPRNAITLLRPRLENAVVAGVRQASVLTNFDERLARPGLEPAGNHNLKPLIRAISGTAPNDHIDTVRSVEALPTGPARGDLRVYAALNEVPASYFGPASGYENSAIGRLHGFRIYPYNLNGNATTLFNGFNKARLGKLVAGVDYYDDPAGSGDEIFGNPIVPNDLVSATMNNGAPGDWDTGPGTHVDGPFINKVDMGNTGANTNYFSTGNNATTFAPSENGASYSPNRQIASAVSFGSLPTGVNPTDSTDVAPWQTLLFCKNPAAGSQHPGFGTPATGPAYTTPPDHAFLDLFTMPIVEPYAISEPFSTAGKVNMNYQIVPFTYLTRSTSVRAVLKSTMMTAIPTGDGLIYKQATNTNEYRYTLSPDEKTGTLKGFQDRFDSGDIFRSASEICDIYLVPGRRVDNSGVPGNPTYADIGSWWNSYQLTGDNLREGPYGHLYPRFTTKSNTFTVHVQTQSLKKTSGGSPDVFVEGGDQVTGEFRGSFIIERYVDPGSDTLIKADGTPGTETDPDSMVGPYKFRIVSSKRFAP